MGRAKKAIESLKRSKKGQKDAPKNVDNMVNENFYVEIAPNPYITAKDVVFVTEKVREERKTSKESVEVQTEEVQKVEEE